MRIVVFLGFLWGAMLASAQTLEFSGYLQTSRQTQFVVTNLESKKSSRWLRQGDAFEGYTITGFDARDEVLSLAKAGEVLRLPLKHSKVEDREATLAGILKRHEDLHANGQLDAESVSLSRVALFSFRRDTSPSLAEKIKNQQLLVAEHEKREERMRAARFARVASELEILEKTEDLLRERIRLREMNPGEDKPSGRPSP